MAKKTAKAPWRTAPKGSMMSTSIVGRVSKVSNLKPKKAGVETVTVTPDEEGPLSFESPTSSNVLGSEYYPVTRVLRVSFHGGRVYQFTSVPRDLWDDFEAAESKGHFFASRIKDKGFGGERL